MESKAVFQFADLSKTKTLLSFHIHANVGIKEQH
jgi:hypothetical protein